MRTMRISKARRLSHINFFYKMAMKKSVLDVQVVNGQAEVTTRLRTIRIVVGLTMGWKVLL